MASGLSANSIFNCRIDGSDTNGGTFVTGASGTDYSQQGAAQYTLTGLTSSGAGNVLLTASASADMIGNGVFCSAGTNANTGLWYQVASVVVGTSLTLTTSNTNVSVATGAASGVNLTIGGALGTPGQMVALATVNGQKCKLKYSATPYTFTTSSPGSGGPLATASATLDIEGYDQAYGDRTGNQPQIAWPATGITLGSLTYAITDTSTAALQRLANIAFNGNGLANAGGISLAHTGHFTTECTVQNFNGTNGVGIGNGTSNSVTLCSVSNCTIGILGSGTKGCFVTGCTTGINGNGSASVESTLITSCTTGITANNTVIANCTIDSCATGISGSGTGGYVLNTVVSNATTGAATGFAAGSELLILRNCFYYNCSTAVSGTPLIEESLTQLTQSPYASSGQYAPNDTAGGGASLRSAAIWIPTQTTNTDAGALQHADPTGGTNYIFQVES